MTTCNVVKALCGSYKSVRIKIVQNKMLNKRGHGEGGGGTGINIFLNEAFCDSIIFKMITK